MINPLLIMITGLLPLLLGFSVLKINGMNRLTISIFLFLLTETIWQIDTAILYMPATISENLILLLFKIFRFGPIMSVPVYLFITYSIIYNQTSVSNNSFFTKIKKIINKKTVIAFFLWSLFVYILGFTSLDIVGLELHNGYYFPVYGELSFIFKIHMISLLFIIVSTFIINIKLQNVYIQKFVKMFVIATLINYVMAMFNFIPYFGMILGVFSVAILSIPIAFSFLNMFSEMKSNYNTINQKYKNSIYTENLLSELIHEINNPLSALVGYCEILPNVQHLNEKGAAIVSELELATSHLKSITYNFSDFVKSGTVRPKSCDVNRIIFESINIMSDLSKHKNIDIMFDGIKDSGVVWDTDKIRQALVNFIKNSIEAIDIDDEEKNITITVKENQFKKGYIDINILDNGCGIPKHIKDKVFNSFVTSKEGGTGIGMTICDKIISSHGGEITIVDSNSNGTNLLITLPRFFVQEGGKFHG